MLEPLNADFDGDTCAIIRVHDNTAQLELQERAFFLNNIFYDHNNNHIQNMRLEVIYAQFILLTKINNDLPIIRIKSLSEIDTSYESLLKYYQKILFNNVEYNIGICTFNIWCGFNDIKIAGFISSNKITEELYKDSKSNEEFHTRLSNLNTKLLWFISTHPDEALSIVLNEITFNTGKSKILLTKLPENPYIGQHLYEGLVSRVYDAIPENYKLKKLTKINIRKTQLSRLIATIGYIADDKNIIDSKSVSDSLLSGLDPSTFFRTAYGTRKGIVDKSQITPKSGYMERSLVINLSPIKLDLEDCGTNLGFKITIISIDHAKSLKYKWYSINNTWEIYNPKDLSNEIGKVRIFRSPITCQNPKFRICKKCFGHYPNIKSPYVGILAGQYLSERLTQLSMRTFHTSGSCTLSTNPNIVKLIYTSLEDIILDNDNNESILIFDKQIPPSDLMLFSEITGFIEYKTENKKTNIRYSNLQNVINQDVSAVIKNINNLLKMEVKAKQIKPITDTYTNFMKYILSVGIVYSSFIEIILCNMYLTKDEQVLRYAITNNINVQPHTKLGIRQLNKIISKLLGLLYEPNELTITKYSDLNTKIPERTDTIFEKFWEGKY